VSCCGDIEEVCEIRWCLAHKGVCIARENFVALCVKQFHFKAQSALAGDLLAGEIVSMDSFVANFPKLKELGPKES
jgi:hypothetical protein